MLTITKNKPKSSMATVKFTTSKPKARGVPKPASQPPVPRHVPNTYTTYPRGGSGVQSRLTEQTFQHYLRGYVRFFPIDLPKTVGNKIRYAIDTIDSGGHVVSTQYRLGGFVKSVAPDLSYVILYNPYAKKQWSLKTRQPNKVVRLYYARRAK